MTVFDPELFNPANFGLINTPKLLDLYNALTAVDGALTALQLPNLRSVRAFGALGNSDGTTGTGADDTAALAAALATGGLLYVPPGVYRFGAGTAGGGAAALTVSVDGTVLLLDPRATLFFDCTTANAFGISLSASNVALLGRGRILGRWDTALNGTDSVQDSRDGSALVRVRPAVNNGDPISGVLIDGPRFERAGGYAVRAVPFGTALYHDVTVRRCHFVENFIAVSFIAPSTTPVRGVTVEDNLVEVTAGPAVTTKNASLGGNAVQFAGPYERVRIAHNRISGAGRMGIELFVSDHSLGYFPTGVEIAGNVVEACTYRSVSVTAVALDMRDNIVRGTTQGWDYVEMTGRQHVVRGNEFIGSGYTATVSVHADLNTGMALERNSWTDIADLTDAASILVKKWRDVRVSDNHLRFTNAVKATFPKSAPVVVEGVAGLAVLGNRIEFGGTCDRDTPATIQLVRGGEIVGNTIVLDDVPDDVISAAMWIGGLDGVRLAHNTARSTRDMTLSQLYGPVAAIGGGRPDFWRWAHDGSGWVKTLCKRSIHNAPPGAPVTGEVYVVGDTPTGAWAGQPRSFAEYNGSGWDYLPIKDVLLHTETFGLPLDDGHLPPAGAAGDAYLLAEGGLIRCIVEGNDMSSAGAIKGTSGLTGFATPNMGQWFTLIWRSVFRCNADPVRLDPDVALIRSATVETLPAWAVPTAGFHEAGTRVPNISPAAGGVMGWVCTARGTPGTWKGYGAVEA